MKRIVFLACIVSIASLIGCNSSADNKAVKKYGASIVMNKQGGFDLYVDGVKTYVKGVGGTNKINLASENGANAFRTWGGSVESIKKDVALAAEHNMFIMQGISLPKNPKAYLDDKFKTEKMEEVREIVETYKDDPNILIWGIGNEIELGGENNSEYSWGYVEEMAKMIKSIDSRHLVATVITHNSQSLDSVAKYVPSLDLIGINSYGPIAEVASMVESSTYDGPYIVTEWGPTGWWETDLTEWNAPIEQTSEEKRIVYETRYNDYILRGKRCLGSFVFLWGQKEERTPTWFSMFVEHDIPGLPLNGEKTPMVEAMQRVWTQKEPEQTAPIINKFTIDGKKGVESPYVGKGKTIVANVDVTDREGDNMTYVWEILKEATITATGGAFEPRPDRVGEVITTDVNELQTSLEESGNYRIYVYVLDNTGFVSTANVPFQVTD